MLIAISQVVLILMSQVVRILRKAFTDINEAHQLNTIFMFRNKYSVLRGICVDLSQSTDLLVMGYVRTR